MTDTEERQQHKNFFEAMTAFRDFEGIANPDHYRAAPQDWYIFITDILNSTEAIADGRYRDVNTLGAASIVVARKVMAGRDFPFVFGGDGATLLVPSSVVEELSSLLLGLQSLARENFGLDLRVGLVSVAVLNDAGHRVEVAKYQETGGWPQAVFAGSGVSAAEDWVKDDPARFSAQTFGAEAAPVDLNGLSCRWKAIPGVRGRVISLLVQLVDDSPAAYGRLLAELHTIMPDGLPSHNPVNDEGLAYKTVRESCRDERRYHKHSFSGAFFGRVLEVFVAVLAFGKGLPMGFDATLYRKALPQHTDFCKFDNTLRVTLDCSPDQVARIRQFLGQRHRAGELWYGIFEGDRTLMTCFVEGLSEGKHFHFIDADDGGYTAAAADLKRQKGIEHQG
ncbi:DUF3095 family protein [Marinimicrobium alkaliphilum]|uniref:DUF3095 family protein n=1 Tax=Marinimicrobium alkaliphilum TaxID=2202654 RepID=UPI000DBA1785|nr:DUF3095 family protein [Marinimicrobium alkaliphilum]